MGGLFGDDLTEEVTPGQGSQYIKAAASSEGTGTVCMAAQRWGCSWHICRPLIRPTGPGCSEGAQVVASEVGKGARGQVMPDQVIVDHGMDYFYFYFIFIEFIAVTLVNKIT